MNAEHQERIAGDIHNTLTRPVVLIGLMGAGKTHMGRLLGKALDVPFVDSDTEIEKAAGMAIPDIFERFGEEYFREGEHRVIKRLLDEGIQVIATGGGAMMRPETAQLIGEKAVSIWIKAELGVMLERTGRNDDRPLLNSGDPETILSTLMTQRYPVYKQADIVVESNGEPAGKVLDDMLEKLHDYICRDEGR